MTSDQGESSQFSFVVDVQDGESTTTAGVPDDTNEFTAGGNLVTVPGAFRGLNAIIGTLLLSGSSEDVTEFG
jgi:hypothetical protein